MKVTVRYFTRTGNTKKLAEAIAQELGIQAGDITAPLDEKAEILFLCNSVYWAGADSSVKKFIAKNKEKIGLLVNVSTAAIKGSTYSQIKKIAQKEGVRLSDQEFHCTGKFSALHSSHPDEADIAAVKAFARKVTGDKNE